MPKLSHLFLCSILSLVVISTALAGSTADLKITKDQASTLVGQPAWSFMAEGITPQTLAPTAPGEKPKIIKHKTKIFRVISVQGNAIYSITFEADD
jgi:hypothetical protein